MHQNAHTQQSDKVAESPLMLKNCTANIQIFIEVDIYMYNVKTDISQNEVIYRCLQLFNSIYSSVYIQFNSLSFEITAGL